MSELSRERIIELINGDRESPQEKLILCDMALAHLDSKEAGRVSVPREPTQAMGIAGAQCLRRDTDEGRHESYGRAIDCWSAMLSAAPAPAQGEPVAMPKPPYDPDYLLEVAENTLIPVDEKKKAALFAVCDLFSKPDGYVKPPQVDHGGQSADSQGTAARVEVAAIKTPEQHKAAMAEIERLMPSDPAPDTPEGKRLELLAVLVEDYERHAFPTDQQAEIDRLRAGLKWYADRHHYDLEEWEDCSGESPNWIFPPIDENPMERGWIVDDGGIARAILGGHRLNPNHADKDEITIPPERRDMKGGE